MLIDPHPIAEAPRIGIPMTTLNIICSKNVAYPAAVE
jgi:hypothetical protein